MKFLDFEIKKEEIELFLNEVKSFYFNAFNNGFIRRFGINRNFPDSVSDGRLSEVDFFWLKGATWVPVVWTDIASGFLSSEIILHLSFELTSTSVFSPISNTFGS